MLEELKKRKEKQVKLERQKTMDAEVAQATAEGLRKRQEAQKEAETPKEYTQEEVKLVREILSTKDYYKMLGVDKKFTEADLKKAYKKKAMKFHPDRNNAPRAKEAFQKINSAMECFSDPAKKRVYDQVGNEEVYQERQSSGGGGGHRGGGMHFRHQGFDGEFVSPEEFFNFMFFGQQPQRGAQRQRPRQQQQHPF